MYDLNFGMIVDVIALSSDKRVFRRLLASAIDHFKAKGMDATVCLMLPHHYYYTILRQWGFIRIPRALKLREFHYVIHINTADVAQEFLLNPTNWFFTFGDSEEG